MNSVPLVPLYGHDSLRARLRSAVRRGTLPASLLIHGPRGVGKQRLALWLGQLMLCELGDSDAAPCGKCRSCRYATQLGHPDLQWFFPRPRPKESDISLEDVELDFIKAINERQETNGLYSPPSGSDGIFIRTVHYIVQRAEITPAMGKRKIFVIGDAHRMVAQEGTEFAANAFLKLLEEPQPDTTMVLTTSEPAALLPTIRSRVVAVRAGRLSDADVRAFLKDPVVSAALESYSLPRSLEERVRLAEGAPGALFGTSVAKDAMSQASALLAAAKAGNAERFRVGLSLSGWGARGVFSDVLDALTSLLHDRVKERASAGDEEGARRAAVAVSRVEDAKLRAAGNVNPQLIGSALLREFAELRP
jgi:DNA polymerase III subunit delta'